MKVTANISVPVTASLGTTRMRVMKTYYTATGPCQSGSDWGQAEDYVINVQLPIPVTSLVLVQFVRVLQLLSRDLIL
jgi:hypothetical protein